MKRIVALLLSVVMLIGVMVPVTSAYNILPFTDVPENAWYHNDVLIAYAIGLINGKTPTTFAPNDLITYSEVIKLAACMHQVYTGAPEISKNGNPWYIPYYDYCINVGIISSYDSFNMSEIITRKGYMAIFAKALPAEALPAINEVDDGMIPDVPMDDEYTDAIYMLYRAGIVQGVDSNYSCNPNGNITRAEVATILTRMMMPENRKLFTLTRPEEVVPETPAVDLEDPDDNEDDNKEDDGWIEDELDGDDSGYTPGNPSPEKPDIGDDDDNDSPNTPVTPNDPEYEEPVYEDFLLADTPIGKLYFPGQWEENVSVRTLSVSTGYAATVKGSTDSGTADLFTVYIGTGNENAELIGYVPDSTGTLNDVRFIIPEFNPSSYWSNDDIDDINAMQEEVNYVIEQICEMPGYTGSINDDTSDEEVYGEFVLLDTPIGKLRYSEKWENSVSVDEATDSERYTADVYGTTPSGIAILFSVYVGDNIEAGDVIGHVNSVEVRIKVHNNSLSGWSEDNKNLVKEMQEDVNYVIQQIRELPGYSAISDDDPGIDDEEVYGEFLLLDTPIGKLYYSEKWQDNASVDVVTTSEGYTAEVYGTTSSGTEKIFTVYVGIEVTAGFVVGHVNGTEVRIDVHDVNLSGWTEADKEIISGMQEDVNYIIEQIKSMSGYSETYEAEEKEDILLLLTPIGDLYYPGEWEDNVSTKELSVSEGYAAEVYGTTSSGTVKIFTVYVGVEVTAGFVVGYVNGTEVRIDVHDVKLSKWTDANKEIVSGMQEDVNYIIEQIKSMSGYSETYEAEEKEDILLLITPIGNLYYPGEWEDNVNTKEFSVSEGYAAEVYGTTSSGTVKLYTIYIGVNTEAGFTLGYVNGTEVRIDVHDVNLSGWTESNKEIVYGMQDEVSYIIEQIMEMPGFSSKL